jgi:hypothetical protein
MRQTVHSPPDFTTSFISATLSCKFNLKLELSCYLLTQKQQYIIDIMQIRGVRAKNMIILNKLILRKASRTKKIDKITISGTLILSLFTINAIMMIIITIDINF